MSYGVVGAGSRHRLLLGLKVLERAALRATVPAEPVVVETPVAAPRARVVERGQDFAGKAVVADAGHGAFDAPFVAGMPHARGIDVKVARLRVLEKRRRDARRQRIGLDDDRLGVIRDQDVEDAAEKLPRRLARLDGACRRFLEGRIHKAVA